jgi:ribokinase
LRDVDLSAVFALTPNELEARVCLGLLPNDPIADSEVALRLLRLGVDTVGAGDAFNAGLAVGLSEQKSTLEAIALGVTAASLSTQRETIASYPYRPEVDLFYEKTLRAAFPVEPKRIG